MSAVPSQDQVMAQLRVILPALGTIVSAFGVNGATANHYVDMGLAAVGPISYIVVAIWSFVENTEANRIKKVADIKGVQSVNINEQASPAVAQVAIDPTIPKVNPTPEAKAQVTATASAA